MVDRHELLAIYDQEMRIDLCLPEMIYENTGRVVRDYSLVDAAGFIDYASLDKSCADAEIDAQVSFFASLGFPFTWKVFNHDFPADLRQRLELRGFKIESPKALLVLDIHNAPAFYWSMTLPDCVKKVTDPAGIVDIVRMEEEVWPAPRDWLRKRLIHSLETNPNRLSLFSVFIDGRIVSAAWTFYYPPTRFASLLGGSTLPDYRKRGYYTSLLVTRVREARQRGYRFLVVDASPMSKPILEKYGFQFLGFSTLCRWSPNDT